MTWAARPTASLVIFSTSAAPSAAQDLQVISAKIAAVAPAGDRPLDTTVFRRTPTGWEPMGQ